MPPRYTLRETERTPSRLLPWLLGAALFACGAGVTALVAQRYAGEVRANVIERQHAASDALLGRLQSDVDVGFSTLSLFDAALGPDDADEDRAFDELALGADLHRLALPVRAMAVARFDNGAGPLHYWHAPQYGDKPPPAGLQDVARWALADRQVVALLANDDGAVSVVLARRGRGSRVLLMLVATQRWIDNRVSYARNRIGLRVDAGDASARSRLFAQSENFDQLPPQHEAGYVTTGSRYLRFEVAVRPTPPATAPTHGILAGLAGSVLLALCGGLLTRSYQRARADARRLARGLDDTERRASAVHAASEDGIWEFDPRARHCRLSIAAARLFGLVPGESAHPAREVLRRVRRADRRVLLGALRVALREGSGLDVEIRAADVDGCERWLRMRARGPEPAQLLIGTVNDISLQRFFSQQISAQRMLLGRVLELSTQAVVVVDADMRCVVANAAFSALAGLAPERIPGRAIHGLALPPGLAGRLTGAAGETSFTWHDPVAGHERTCRLHLADSPGADGRALRVCMVSEARSGGADLALLQQMQQETQRRRDQLEAIRRLQEAFIRAPEGRAPFDAMLDALLTLTGSEHGFVGEVLQHEGGLTLRVPSVGGLSWSDAMRAHYELRAGQGIELRAIERIFGERIREGRPLIVDDAGQLPQLAHLPPGHPQIRNFIGLPVHYGSMLIGLVGLANREGGFRPQLFDEIAPLLRSVGEVITARRTELARRDAERELEGHRDRLSDLVREQTAGLRAARDAAEAANEAKSAFLANMSHELRTPLHAALSFARLGEARTGAVSEVRLREYFTRIRQSGERLLALLDGLLDLARLEAGGMSMDLAPTDLAALVADIEREFQALLAARGQRIARALDHDLPHVACDGQRIGQVLRNLVANAIKFSPQDSVISIAMAADAHGAELRVSDQGPGIPADEREAVFEKFVQGSAARTGAGGTGLGLAICREIVAAHGGVIFARDAAGGGAEIVVRLPATILEMQTE